MENCATSAITAPSPFKAGEDGFLVTRLDADHAAGRQTGLRQGRREEVLAGHAPQDLSACPRGDAAGEEGVTLIVAGR
jgi:hypothetical protein